MNGSPLEQKPTPPYVSATTFLGFLEKLKSGLPTHIDRSLMNGYSGGVASQIMVALRFFGLIDGAGETKPQLTKLVAADSEARPAVLRDMILQSYPFMAAGFDLGTATTSTLESKIREMGVSGDTVKKCLGFLVSLAKEAGITVGPHVKFGRSGAKPNVKPKNRKKPVATAPLTPQSHPAAVQIAASTAPATAHQDIYAVAMEKLPQFDPTWSPEAQKSWLGALEILLKAKQEADDKG
ncbi:MAG: hypothetical protein U0S12_05410 [Fimbriimonadales bacterium]